jgi:outer membrane lipoprotein-sorting protein
MKTLSKFLAVAFAVAACTFVTHAQTKPAGDLKTVIAELDKASKTFTSAQASVQYDNYTRIVHAHDLETGSIVVERSGSSTNMNAAFYDLGPDGKPAKTPSKVLAYDGGTLQIYSPGVNQVDVFKAGANQAKYESFLTLGFGGSGTDLARAWNIQDDGPETIDGVATEKLELASKDPSVSSMFKTVTIWVDLTRGISLKQIFVAPNGDMRTALYTNIKLNAKHIDKGPYAISKSATRIAH